MCEPLLLSNFLVILFALRITYATHLGAVKFLENLSERVKKKITFPYFMRFLIRNLFLRVERAFLIRTFLTKECFKPHS